MYNVEALTEAIEAKLAALATAAEIYKVELPEAWELKDYEFTATKAARTYTMTIVNGEETEVITFAAEADADNNVVALADLATVLAGKLPAEDENNTYAWAEEAPATFELQNYTFTVVATAKTPVENDSTDSGNDSTDSGNDSTDSATQDSVVEGESSEASNSLVSLFNCSGGIGSLATGIMALGVCAMALLKKKED